MWHLSQAKGLLPARSRTYHVAESKHGAGNSSHVGAYILDFFQRCGTSGGPERRAGVGSDEAPIGQGPEITLVAVAQDGCTGKPVQDPDDDDRRGRAPNRAVSGHHPRHKAHGKTRGQTGDQQQRDEPWPEREPVAARGEQDGLAGLERKR